MLSELNLPIYYEEQFKTKPSKTHLVSDNWFRNIHYHLKNKVKQHYHQLVTMQLKNPTPVVGQFTLDIIVFYKNPNCDGSNIASRIEKFTLDALQEASVVVNDNVKYHIGTTWSIGGQDKLNPRAIIKIKEVSNGSTN